MNTLSCCRTKDLVKFEEPVTALSLFGGIHDNQLPILTHVLYGGLFLTLSRKEWSYPTINSNISYQIRIKICELKIFVSLNS